MKKLTYLAVIMVAAFALGTSCGGDEKPAVAPDETLLFGKWCNSANGTEFYKFNSNHTGGFWDTADRLTEEQAWAFSWSLNTADLEVQYNDLMQPSMRLVVTTQTRAGAISREYYTILELTATRLRMKDTGGTYTYTKQP